MKYYCYTWNNETKGYSLIEIDENKTYSILSKCYRTSLVKRLKGKSFRLRTRTGWIETETTDGLIPAVGFYGICE